MKNQTPLSASRIAYYNNCKEVLQLYSLVKAGMRKDPPRLPIGDFRRHVAPQTAPNLVIKLKNIPALLIYSTKNLVSKSMLHLGIRESFKGGVEGTLR